LAETQGGNRQSPFDAAARKAAGLPIWRGKVEPVPLGGGLSNTNFIVEDSGRRYVVRVGGDVSVHSVIRRNEAAASRAAYLAGVSPELVHAESGALVLAFVEGQCLSPADVRDPGNLGKILEIVRQCHDEIPRHLRGPGLFFWVFHAIRDYGHTLADHPATDRRRLARLLAAGEELESAVGAITLIFGHNDLLAANFIDDGKRLWLVDWEYAGFNSPLFDLGGLASNSEMPEPTREEMLAAYFEAPVTDELRHRFAAMTAASLLRETMWSMVAEIHSTLDYDYAAYTAENLARFEKAFAAFTAMGRV
jgi:thiamine kinase-like enzyme